MSFNNRIGTIFYLALFPVPLKLREHSCQLKSWYAQLAQQPGLNRSFFRATTILGQGCLLPFLLRFLSFSGGKSTRISKSCLENAFLWIQLISIPTYILFAENMRNTPFMIQWSQSPSSKLLPPSPYVIPLTFYPLFLRLSFQIDIVFVCFRAGISLSQVSNVKEETISFYFLLHTDKY